MQTYILFLDTETSGLPKRLDRPCDASEWPYIVQVSWLVYTMEGQLIDEKSLYIADQDFETSASSLKIHRISDPFRRENGYPRNDIMRWLSEDLRKYEPIVVCHFAQFDLKMLEVEFYRSAVQSNLASLTIFCTMLASKTLVSGLRGERYLRLEQLHTLLCDRDRPLEYHDANVDARATAECFFALYRMGYITSDSIKQQRPLRQRKGVNFNLRSGLCYIGLILLLTILIYQLL